MLNEQERSRLAQLSQKFGQPAGLSQVETQRLAELEQKFKPQMPNQPVQAAIEGFGQAASFGYLPQLQAGAEKAINYLVGDSTDEALRAQGFNIEDPSYTQIRDEFIARNQRLQETNPGAMLTGQVAGGLSSGLAAGALGGTAKAATLGQRALSAAKTGAAIGAIRNPGDTEGEVDLLQLRDRLKNTSQDALTGLIAQGGAEGVAKLAKAIQAAPAAIKDFSQAKAFKASGAMLKDFRKAYGRGRVGELGQTMIDNKIVALGDDVADVAKKAEVMRQSVGGKIGDIYQSADEAILKINPAKVKKNLATKLDETELDMGRFAQEFRAYITNKMQGLSGSRQVLSRMDAELDDLATNGVVSLKRLQEIRRSIDDQIDFAKQAKDLPGVEQAFLEMRTKINDIAKNRLAVIDQIKGTALSKDLAKANRDFSNLSEITKIAKDRVARDSTNAAFGLRERISGGAGAVVGGMVGGVPGAVAGGVIGSISTKVAKEYGTPFVAIAANRAARALESNPGLLGKFTEPLIKSATSPKEFVSVVNLMLKDPEFKKKIDAININKVDE
jgi:hypothetical protein